MSDYQFGIVLAGLLIGSMFGLAIVSVDIDEENIVEDLQDNEVNPTILDSESVENQNIEEYKESVATVHSNTEDSIGAGFLYAENYLVTNEHVVSSVDEYTVKFTDDQWIDAEVIGKDPHTDVAVLELDSQPQDISPLTIDKREPYSGEDVFTIGSPQGFHDSISEGVVSGTNRSIQIESEYLIPDTIQTDVSLEPGNSGGPLISQETGGVIGIVRATSGENLGYATSSRLMVPIANSLIENGEHNHARVGITSVDVNSISEEEYDINEDVESGLYITEISEDTPADGVLQEEDIVKKIDETKVNDIEELSTYLLSEKEAGDIVEFEIIRDGTSETVELILEER